MPKKAVASEARRCLLNVRTTEAIRKKLEEAAAASGRPLIHEVEHRLELAFWVESHDSLEREMFSNQDNQDLGTAIKLASAFASKFSDNSWRDSGLTRHMIKSAVNKTIDMVFEKIQLSEEELSAPDRDASDLNSSIDLIAKIASSQATHKISDN